MDMTCKDQFVTLWRKHFDGAELPIVFYYYADEPGSADPSEPPSGHRCIFADLSRVRAGHSLFRRMVDNMDESFLITGSWGKVRKRIANASKDTATGSK